jgi:hypothetical protein
MVIYPLPHTVERPLARRLADTRVSRPTREGTSHAAVSRIAKSSSRTVYSYRVREDVANGSTGAIAMVEHLLSYPQRPALRRFKHRENLAFGSVCFRLSAGSDFLGHVRGEHATQDLVPEIGGGPEHQRTSPVDHRDPVLATVRGRSF